MSKKKEIVLPVKKKKKEEPPFEYWQVLVKTFFDFCEKYYKQKPSFDGSAPRDLKAIAVILKKRATEESVAWTKEQAAIRLQGFLIGAYKDVWLHDNFVLSNLNKFKDKVFFNKEKNKNGTVNFTGFGTKPNLEIKPAGSFGKL